MLVVLSPFASLRVNSAKDPGIYFRGNTGMLRFAQHDRSAFFITQLEMALLEETPMFRIDYVPRFAQ
jgi:hypothetical protein